MSPDEVRKMDNKKCLIFIKGYDPVLDDKYSTYEKEEFRRATAMGPYKHHLITEEMIEESRRSMYVDSPEDLYQSYYYQVEDCLGIFEESVIFKDYTDKLDKGYVISTRLPGYEIEKTMAIIYPLFELEVSEYVRSGANTLKKHDLIGYVDQNKCVLIEDEEALIPIFNEIMREKTPGKNGGGE